ncbi:hypothetical protein BYT27DRAFT_7206940 [Phlegmacium glaucopus]|nr:hypothetical protein BYT27DRAFT_7206940 [Phlegmacium glaucopus]
MANIRREAGAYREQWRVTIPASKKLPPVPNPWTGDNSQSSHREPKNSKILRYHLLACDQRSFLTGSRRVDMQAAHIIDTVRRDNRRKMNVEELLTQQRLHHSSFQTFQLDSIINCILLEATYHVQWDLYGTFCIVPAVDDACAMLSALRTSNQKWIADEIVDRLARPLDHRLTDLNGTLSSSIHKPYFPMARRFQLLKVDTSRPKPPSRPKTRLTWTYWVALGDQLVSASDPGDFFPPFTAQDARSTTRTPYPPISSLAMVINSNAKLQSFMKDHRASATPRITMFANLVSELMDEIFFVPRGFYSRLDDPLFSQVFAQSHLVVGAASIGAVSGTGKPNPTGHGFGQPSTAFGAMEEPDAPEQPDDDDGLTPSEFRLLAQQARDPELTPRDRSNAASMLICGVHGFAKPYAFESLEDV